jgi:hypothetical protein
MAAKGKGKSTSTKTPTGMGNNPFANMPKAMKDIKAQGKGKGKKGY